MFGRPVHFIFAMMTQVYGFFAPLGGLPSRVPQILIDLVCLFVCLLVRDGGIFTRWHMLLRRDISRSFLTGSQKRSGASGVLRSKEPKVGSRKFVTFFFRKCSIKKPTDS